MMKKLLGILFLSLLLSGNTYADEPRVWFKNENTIHIAHKTHFTNWHKDVRRVAVEHCTSHDKYMFWVQTTRGGAAINKHYKKKIKDTYKGSWVTEIFCSKEKLIFAPKDSFVPGDKIYATNFIETKETNEVKKIDIEFTIKDKKEQCTAIGFEPATEKFADCVLRLVELDVKTQQTNQIALAQSQGNQQVANQLKKQRNDQSSQYFLDLGQKLLNPQSTVSAPSTSTCRVTGGVYKTVSCW
jgi:hypothetical protein